MDKKKKGLIGGMIIGFFAAISLMMAWFANHPIPESERCDGGHSCAMKYADDLQEMKDEKSE